MEPINLDYASLYGHQYYTPNANRMYEMLVMMARVRKIKKLLDL
jgi:hypothetical protein